MPVRWAGWQNCRTGGGPWRGVRTAAEPAGPRSPAAAAADGRLGAGHRRPGAARHRRRPPPARRLKLRHGDGLDVGLAVPGRFGTGRPAAVQPAVHRLAAGRGRRRGAAGVRGRLPGRPPERPPARRPLAGLAVCALATNSSIAVYDMSLFTAHMIGHLMLVMAAPALLMAGQPLNLLLAATDGATRQRIQRILLGRVVSLLTAPPVALASYTVVIVGTHLTGLMDQIMRHTWAGQLEHLAYLVLGCQFFVMVVGDPPIRWKLAAPARLFMLALSMAVDTFTGVTLL